MTNTPSKPGDRVQTRHGRPAEVVAVHIERRWPLCVEVTHKDGTKSVEWYTADGRYSATGFDHDYDLIPLQ